MASAKRDIRHIIDSFSEDLIDIAQEIAREQVERAVAEWQAKNQKFLAKKAIEEEKSLRNRKALERIERVAERRREREQKKAAERALRLEQHLISSSVEKTERKPGRTRRGGLLAEAASKPEPAPPPLFVHKRRRDGEIQQLKRSEDELSVANGSTAGSAPIKATAANGSAATQSGSNPSPVVPEQLLLGL